MPEDQDHQQDHQDAATADLDPVGDDFDIRAWRVKRGLPARIDDPDQVAAITALLRRDLASRDASGG